MEKNALTSNVQRLAEVEVVRLFILSRNEIIQRRLRNVRLQCVWHQQLAVSYNVSIVWTTTELYDFYICVLMLVCVLVRCVLVCLCACVLVSACVCLCVLVYKKQRQKTLEMYN